MDDPNQRKDQGMERRDTTKPDQDQQKKSSSFVRDGVEVFNYKNPATVVTFGIVAFVFFIISITLVVDRRGSAEIEKIVIRTVPSVKINDDGPTLRTEIQNLKDKDRDLNNGIEKCLAFEPRIKFCEDWIIAPYKNPKAKGK